MQSDTRTAKAARNRKLYRQSSLYFKRQKRPPYLLNFWLKNSTVRDTDGLQYINGEYYEQRNGKNNKNNNRSARSGAYFVRDFTRMRRRIFRQSPAFLALRLLFDSFAGNLLRVHHFHTRTSYERQRFRAQTRHNFQPYRLCGRVHHWSFLRRSYRRKNISFHLRYFSYVHGYIIYSRRFVFVRPRIERQTITARI